MLNAGYDQAAGLRKMVSGNLSSPKIVTFLSSVSSTNATALLANLAASLTATGSSVLILDARTNNAGVAYFSNLNKCPTIWDAAFGDIEENLVLVDLPMFSGVKIASLGLSPKKNIGSMEVDHLGACFNKIIKEFDIVLVDAEINAQDHLPMSSLENGEIVIEVTSSTDSIMSAYTMMKRLTGTLGKRAYAILVSGVNEKASVKVYENMAATASKYLAVPVSSIGSMPTDDHVIKARSLGKSVIDAFPLAGASVAFRSLANKLSLKTVKMSS